MNIGDKVKVLPGASEWMKRHGYWLQDMGDSIDGCVGVITDDNTALSGNDAHYTLDIGISLDVGVNNIWLIKLHSNETGRD